jgi:outer membrane receptor protein involved in Fe transport
LRVSQLQTSANATFLIRGFGNGANNAGVEPSVGVFIDGVYRSRSAASLADFPNLERIEVIKGPQSTLFGKNASAGVINVVTAKPSLDAYSGSASLTYGDYNHIVVKGDVTGPLSDTFAWSLSGSYNERDGYFTNLETGTKFNELNRWGVRGQLLWAPTDNFEARFIADMDEFEEVCCGVAHLQDGVSTIGIRSPGVGGDMVSNSPFSYTGLYNFDAINEIENSGVSLQLDWDINDYVTLTSITAYRNLQRFDNADSDFTTAALLAPEASNLTDTELDTFTQEFRLSGSVGNTDWLIGAFWFDEDVEQNSGVIFDTGARPYVDTMTKLLIAETPADFVDALNPAVPSPMLQLEGLIASSYAPDSLLPPLAPDVVAEFGPILPGQSFLITGQGTLEAGTLTNEAISLFAQADFGLGDRTTVTLGINYTEDEKNVAVSTLNDNVFSYVDLEDDIGQPVIFATVLGQLLATPGACTGPDDPVCLGQAALASQAGKGVSCSDVPAGVPCNPVLDLQQVQIIPPFVNFPNEVEPGQ